MKREVYVLTNYNHYDDTEIYVWANAYGSLAKAQADMLADFNARFLDTFYPNPVDVCEMGDGTFMELRASNCYCTWGIECQSVEFDD